MTTKTRDVRTGAAAPAQVSAENAEPVTEAAQAEPQESAVEADPWADALAAPLAEPFTRARVDIETVPASLRTLFENNLVTYFIGLDASGREVGHEGSGPEAYAANSMKFRQFDAGNEKRAAEFVKFAKIWGANRREAGAPNEGRVTMRAFQIKKDNKLTSVVKFGVMPYQAPKKSEKKADGRPDAALVRDWARRNGIQVPERGKLSQDVYDAYVKALQTEAAAQAQSETENAEKTPEAEAQAA